MELSLYCRLIVFYKRIDQLISILKTSFLSRKIFVYEELRIYEYKTLYATLCGH